MKLEWVEDRRFFFPMTTSLIIERWFIRLLLIMVRWKKVIFSMFVVRLYFMKWPDTTDDAKLVTNLNASFLSTVVVLKWFSWKQHATYKYVLNMRRSHGLCGVSVMVPGLSMRIYLNIFEFEFLFGIYYFWSFETLGSWFHLLFY